MSAIIGALRGVLSLDSAAFEKGAKRAEASMGKLEKKLFKSGKAMQSAGRKMSLAITAPMAAMATLAVKSSLRTIDAQAKLAQSLGTTVKSMQVLQRAADLSGVSMGDVEQATIQLTKRLSEVAATGKGPAAGALEKLGLSVKKLQGMTLDARITAIQDALQEFVPAAERAAVATDLFGTRAGITFTRIDSSTLRQASVDVADFGVAVSEVDADQIERTNDAISRLGLIGQGVGNQLAAAFAPVLEGLSDKLAGLAKWFENLGDGTKRFIAIVATIAAALGPALVALGLMAVAVAPLAAGFAALLSPVGLLVGGFAALAGVSVYLASDGLGLGDSQGVVGEAVRSATDAAEAQLTALQSLRGETETSRLVSLDFARAKLLEAEALAKTAREIVATAQAKILASDQYRAAVSDEAGFTRAAEVAYLELQQAKQMVADTPLEHPLRAEYMANLVVLREHYEGIQQEIENAKARQAQMLAQVGEASALYKAATAEVARLRAELAAAVNGMVQLGPAATELTKEIAKARVEAMLLSGVDVAAGITPAVAAAQELAAQLGLSLQRALTISGALNTRPAGDVFDPRQDSYTSQEAKLERIRRSMDEMTYSTEWASKAADEFKRSGSGAGKAVSDAMKSAEQATKAAKQAAEQYADALNAPIVSAVDSMADAIGTALTGGFDSFKDFGKSILNSFKSMVSQMISFAISNPIKIAMGIGGVGLPGAASAATGALGGGGLLGNLLGGGGSGVLGGVMTGVKGIFTGGGLGSSFANLGGLLSGSVGGAGAIGAALPAIGILALGLGLFISKTKVLDQGIRVTTNSMDTLVEHFQHIEKSRLFGLIKSKSFKTSAMSDDEAAPIVSAINEVRDEVLSAAAVFGVGNDALKDFASTFDVSFRGLETEQEKMDALAEALGGFADDITTALFTITTKSVGFPGGGNSGVFLDQVADQAQKNALIHARQWAVEELPRFRALLNVSSGSNGLGNVGAGRDAVGGGVDPQHKVGAGGSIRGTDELDKQYARFLRKLSKGTLDFTSKLWDQFGAEILAKFTEGRGDPDLTLNFDEALAQAVNTQMENLLEPFMREGEEAYATLQRLASSVTTVNSTFDVLGYGLFDLTQKNIKLKLAAADAASELADLFGGLEGFTTAVGTFVDRYYSDAEKIGIYTKKVSDELDGMFSQKQIDRMASSEKAYRRTVDRFGALVATDADAKAKWAALLGTDVQSLMTAIHDLGAAAASTAVDLGGVTSKLPGELTDLMLAAVTTAYDAAVASIAAKRERLTAEWEKTFDKLGNTVDRFTKRAGLLQSALGSRKVEDQVAALMRYQTAQAWLFKKSEKKNPKMSNNKLEKMLDALNQPTKQFFGSATDYARDFYKTNIAMNDLNDKVGEQLTEAEKRMEQAERHFDRQIEKLDKQLAWATRQYNALLGIDASVKSVGAAMVGLRSAIVAAVDAASAGSTSPPDGLPLVIELSDREDLKARAIDAGVSLNGRTPIQVRRDLELVTGQVFDKFWDAGKGRKVFNTPRFANGGVHTGGLRIVGERGPELEATGASRIMSNNNLSRALGNNELTQEVRALRQEVSRLRAEQGSANTQIAKHTKRTADTNRKWDRIGLPAEQIV